MGRRLEVPLDRTQGQSALHVVSAWTSEQRLILAQLKVEDKSNEITAIPALLELLELTGAIITIDAMGTQTEIAQKIINESWKRSLKRGQRDCCDQNKRQCQDAIISVTGDDGSSCIADVGRGESIDVYSKRDSNGPSLECKVHDPRLPDRSK